MREITLAQQLAKHVRTLRQIEMIRPLLYNLTFERQDQINLLLDADMIDMLEIIKTTLSNPNKY